MTEQMSPEVTQMLHSLEQRYVKLRDDHVKVKSQRDDLLSKESSLEEQLAEEQRQMRAARAASASLEAAALDQKRFLQRTQAELTASREDLERSRREAERLSAILGERFASADEAAARSGAIQKELFDLQAKQVPLEFDRDKLVREKEALTTQNAWLDRELEEKAAELRELKQLHASEAASLRSSADAAAADASSFRESLARAREVTEDRSAALEKAQAEAAQCRAEACAARSEFEGQVGAEQRAGRLAGELKLLAEAALKERERDLEGLRRACLEAEAAWEEERRLTQDELEKRTVNAQAQLEAKQSSNDEVCAKLQAAERQVVSLTQQQSQLQLQAQQPRDLLALPPSTTIPGVGAAAAGAGSGGALTVMEVFGQLQEKDSAWRAEKAERQRLEVNLDAILRELEKKAPILESQRRDYKRALVAHNRLTEKLELAVRSEQSLTSEAERLTLRADSSEKEAFRLKQQNSDLARQVQHLLRAQVDRSLGSSSSASSSSSALALRQNTPTRGGGGFSFTPNLGAPLTPQQQQLALVSGGGGFQAAGSAVLSPHDVVSENLVVVSDVADMQRNNMYLIATVRALTEDLEKASALSSGGVFGDKASRGGQPSQEVASLQAEVAEMKQARQREEELLGIVVKQRDVFRLAAQAAASGLGGAADSTALALSSPPATPEQQRQSSALTLEQQHLSPGAAGVAAAEERFAAVEQNLRASVLELERRLVRAEEERGVFKQLKEQLAGDEQAAVKRAAGARQEAEREGAQAKFLAAQVARLQQDLASAQRECDLLRQRGSKGDATVEAQERSLAEREASVVELTDRCRRAEAKGSALEQARAIAEASEQRFKDDNVRLRSEMKQTSGLVESMQRIESGLSASKASEVEGLVLERDKLRQALEQARQDAGDVEVRQEQAREAGQAEVRQERSKADASNEALGLALEKAAGAELAVAAAGAKADALEAQLAEAHERSERREATLRGFASGSSSSSGGGGLSGEGEEEAGSEVGGGNTGLSAALAALEAYELKSKHMAVNLEAATSAAQAAEERASVYQSLAEANERALGDVATAASSKQAELSGSLEEATAQVATLSAEVSAQRSRLRELELAAHELEDACASSVASLKREAGTSAELVASLQGSVDASAAREAGLAQELEQHRNATGRAQANYERELQLHAEANAKARTAEAGLAQEKGQQAQLEQRAAALQAQLVEKEAGWGGEKQGLEAAREAAVARAEELGVTNALLHAEVQRLGAEVDRVQEVRLGAALGTAAGAGSSSDQATALAGLRRVLLGVRKEKDLVEAKLSASAHQCSIKEQLAHHLGRELDEARAELKARHEGANIGAGFEGEEEQVGEHGGGASSSSALSSASSLTAGGGVSILGAVGGGPKGMHAKLVAQLEENNLIRESNAMLRGEANRLTAKLNECEQRVLAFDAELEPLRSSLRQCEADKAAAVSEGQELASTVGTWKARVDTLTTQYKLVDPDEHERVTAELAAARASLEEARASLAHASQTFAREKKALSEGLQGELAAEQSKAREAQQKAGVGAAEAASTVAQLSEELESVKGLKVQAQRSLEASLKELGDASAAHAQEMAMANEKYENVRVSARGVMEKRKEALEQLEKEIAELKKEAAAVAATPSATKAAATPPKRSKVAAASTPSVAPATGGASTPVVASSSTLLSSSGAPTDAAVAPAATALAARVSPKTVPAAAGNQVAATKRVAAAEPAITTTAAAAPAAPAAVTKAVSSAPPAAPAEVKPPSAPTPAQAKKPAPKPSLGAKPTPTKAVSPPLAAAAAALATGATVETAPSTSAAAGTPAAGATEVQAALRARLLANKRPAPTTTTTTPATAEAKSGAPRAAKPAGAKSGAVAKPTPAVVAAPVALPTSPALDPSVSPFEPAGGAAAAAAAAAVPAASAIPSPAEQGTEDGTGPAAKKSKPSAPAAAKPFGSEASSFSFTSPVAAKASAPASAPASSGNADVTESEADKKAMRMARFEARKSAEETAAAQVGSQKRPATNEPLDEEEEGQPAPKKPTGDGE